MEIYTSAIKKSLNTVIRACRRRKAVDRNKQYEHRATNRRAKHVQVLKFNNIKLYSIGLQAVLQDHRTLESLSACLVDCLIAYLTCDSAFETRAWSTGDSGSEPRPASPCHRGLEKLQQIDFDFSISFSRFSLILLYLHSSTN